MKPLFKKKYYVYAIQIIITILFVTLTFHGTHFATLKNAFLEVNYWILCLSLIPQLFALFFLTLREKYLLHDLYPFHLRDLMKGTMICFVGNNILPLRAGEFLKVLYWSRKSAQSYVSLLSVAFLERVFDLLCLIFLFLIGSKEILFKLGVEIEWVVIIVALIIAPMGVLVFLDWKYKKQFALHDSLKHVFGEKITHYCNDFLNKLMRGFRVLGSAKNSLFALFFSILYWAVNLFGLAMVLYAFHLTVSWQLVVVILLSISLGTAIPASPGFIGTWDYFAKTALVLYGVNASVATSFAIASHVMSIVPLTLIGILFIYPVMSELMRKTK